ncbi:hypothetical protein JW899_05325 [Candidatus Uhrbacteria bacterium]|nr:hypothetical protein [Candidatus Uhrbacteria bacterium]
MTMSKRHFFLLPSVAIAVILTGGGCIREVDEDIQSTVDRTIGIPIGAYEQAVRLTDGEQARQHREEEAESNYVTVAMIVTEGSAVPDGVTLGPTIGCNDRVAFIKVSRLTDSGQVVIDALNTLFGLNDATYGGLHNSLAESTLKVSDRAYTTGSAGVEIRMEGSVMSAGTCDDPRIRAQIEETIRYFEPNFTVILNDSDSAWRCFGNQTGLCK